MKKILIPTDFSDNAKDAFAFALKFVSKEPSELQVLHVIEPVFITVMDTRVLDTKTNQILQDEAENTMRALEGFSSTYLESYGIENIKLTTKVVSGDVVDSIKSIAKVNQVDLIIMGTQGKNHSLLEKTFGTISTKVLNIAPCPIVLIPKDYQFQEIDNIIFASNLDHGDPFELDRALKVLEPNTPLVRVVHVKNLNSQNKTTSIEDFASYIVKHSPSIRTEFHAEESTDVEAMLGNYGWDYNAEMIIMQKSKKTLLQKLFGLKHTKRMVNKMEIPLMILN